ncbi:hypothetical protein SeMB42_g02991 [Synchytrium endobioticum]|uniref:Uncharacterized protein n=1 Tax=Synchytrium endobioticum TaxID=286115 RepID=A0A507DBJ6_9FUNG|nr:hypothetical protein SeMB42_g02991 [Synchytrium endobioticum]TPX49022.1 hypothetical protein SeLEV6574_g01701 [Synchytrium endobioticum]
MNYRIRLIAAAPDGGDRRTTYLTTIHREERQSKQHATMEEVCTPAQYRASSSMKHADQAALHGILRNDLETPDFQRMARLHGINRPDYAMGCDS